MRRALIFAFFLLAPISRAQSDPQKAAFAALSKSMDAAPADQRLAFNALTVTYATFLDAHLRHEVCRTTDGCAEARITDKARLDDGFRFAASGFSSALPPNFTAEELAASDNTLNSLYNKVLDTLPTACATGSTCLSQPTFKDVQRDWIRYRDAFVTFGTLRYPNISSDSWLTYLTRQRITQLQTTFAP